MRNLIYNGLFCLVLLSCSEKISTFNEAASVSDKDELPENPLAQIALTSSIQPAENTMSVLYGNAIAAKHARAAGDNRYPNNAQLYQVTWSQKPDSLWFGAKIPEQIKSVEIVQFNENAEQEVELNYTHYSSSPLRKSAPAGHAEERIKYILAQKMASLP